MHIIMIKIHNYVLFNSYSKGGTTGGSEEAAKYKK